MVYGILGRAPMVAGNPGCAQMDCWEPRPCAESLRDTRPAQMVYGILGQRRDGLRDTRPRTDGLPGTPAVRREFTGYSASADGLFDTHSTPTVYSILIAHRRSAGNPASAPASGVADFRQAQGMESVSPRDAEASFAFPKGRAFSGVEITS